MQFDTVSTLRNGLQTAKIPIEAIYKISSREQEKRIIAMIKQRKMALDKIHDNSDK